MTAPTRAVVLGGGLAGTLAAAALARHLDEVTVVDRDTFPAGSEPRKGLPQARHAHLLWSGGARAIESLLPGTVERWLAAGARRIGVHQEMVSLTAYGWQHRFPGTQFMIACTRPLLDRVVREQMLREPRITVRTGTEALGLIGDPNRVTGVRVQPRGGEAETLAADLVIDATGRASPMDRWLPSLGVPAPRTDRIDPGIVYATRIYRAPFGMADWFPPVSVYADHRDGTPGRNGVVLPVEDGRWMVTLSGTRGGEPGAGADEFDAFARSLRHGIVADLIAAAEPITAVRRTHSTVNRRLFWEQVEPWPAGLVVLGDALAALNPVYGHGMSSAALGAVALEAALAEHGLAPRLAATAQRAVGAVADDPWIFAAAQDICFPDCRVAASDPRLGPQAPERRRFAELIGATAIRSPALSAATTAVSTLSAPSAGLEDPAVLAELRRGPQRPELVRPPLKAGERALVEQCALAGSAGRAQASGVH